MASGIDSLLGEYGLTSRMGVPTIASRPLTFNPYWLFEINLTVLSPIGLGLDGLLQAKTPIIWLV